MTLVLVCFKVETQVIMTEQETPELYCTVLKIFITFPELAIDT